MPECVETEAVTTLLRRQLSGTTLEWVNHRSCPAATSFAASSSSSLAVQPTVLRLPARVEQLVAHAKELHIRLQGGQVLVVHFMLEGRLQTLTPLSSSGGTRSKTDQDGGNSSCLAVTCFNSAIVSATTTIATLQFMKFTGAPKQEEQEQEPVHFTFAVTDTQGLATVRAMEFNAYTQHARNFAPALWRPTESESATHLLPLLSRVLFARRCHAHTSTRSVADILKEQRGTQAVCSGLGKWLIWQLCVATQCDTTTPMCQALGPTCAKKHTRPSAAAASIHSFFSSTRPKGASSVDVETRVVPATLDAVPDTKRRKSTHAASSASTSATVAKTNGSLDVCRCEQMYDAMQRIATSLYTQLISLASVDAIFCEYKGVRRRLCYSPSSGADIGNGVAASSSNNFTIATGIEAPAAAAAADAEAEEEEEAPPVAIPNVIASLFALPATIALAPVATMDVLASGLQGSPSPSP